VLGLASTTAAGLAGRITPAQWEAVEHGPGGGNGADAGLALSMPGARKARHAKIIYEGTSRLTALFTESGQNIGGPGAGRVHDTLDDQGLQQDVRT
jgi:hypothetical protein